MRKELQRRRWATAGEHRGVTRWLPSSPALAGAFVETAQRLLPAMTELVMPGAPLSAALLGELIDRQRRFDGLRAGSARWPGRSTWTSPRSRP